MVEDCVKSDLFTVIIAANRLTWQLAAAKSGWPPDSKVIGLCLFCSCIEVFVSKSQSPVSSDQVGSRSVVLSMVGKVLRLFTIFYGHTA